MALVAAQYLKGVADILKEYDETEESANYTITQVLVTALGALVGAAFGGRTGGAMGGAAGAAASYYAVPDYKPLAQCISDMKPEKRMEIATKIQNRIGNPAILAVREFMRSAPANVAWVKEQFAVA